VSVGRDGDGGFATALPAFEHVDVAEPDVAMTAAAWIPDSVLASTGATLEARVGNLFRSQEFIKGQTELVIFVTPRLAKAFDADLAKLPTDDFIEPSDTEFYLLGRMEGRRPSLGPDKTGAEGVFGHEL
jgi:hypothetical protein